MSEREILKDEIKDSHLAYDGFKQKVYRSRLLQGDNIELYINGELTVAMICNHANSHFHITIQSKTSKKIETDLDRMKHERDKMNDKILEEEAKAK